MSIRAFIAAADTVNQAVSGTAAEKRFSVRGGTKAARIYLKDATAEAFIKFGPTGMTAATTTNAMPFPADGLEVQLTREQYFSVIGTDGTLYVTDGDGI